MKIYVDSDESYPVYGASEFNSEYDKCFVEITEEEWDWVQ